MADTKLSIKDIVFMTGFTPAYIRKLIREGSLIATDEPIEEGSEVKRKMITLESFDAYMAKPRRHARADHRNRYILHANDEEIAVITEAAKANGLNIQLQRAYRKGVRK